MSIYTIAWIGWILAFCVIEGLALRSRREERTLSGHVWAVLKFRKLFWLLGAAFLLWVSIHFLSLGSFT